MPRLSVAVFCLFTLPLTGCRDSPPPPATTQLELGLQLDNQQVERSEADMSVLFIGNSHTSTHDVPGLFAALVHADNSKTKVFTRTCDSGSFLADHAANEMTVSTINDGPWDFVVLQAQKYSTSGKYKYPYDAAIKLSELAEKQGAKVVMFPEWGQSGNPDEARRVHSLHEEIAELTGALVSPVGLAWDRATVEHPNVRFHQDDGNHASTIGAYLTACVLYATITGRNPSEIPSENDLLASLQRIAWETVLPSDSSSQSSS